MTSRRFIQCDVFTPTPTLGNGLAVVVDGLSAEAMQRFAAWTCLAETTFIQPPGDPLADYRLRIFTPLREMRFAGHPTLGSCAAWLHAVGVPREPGVVRQECGVGLVDIDIGDPALPAFVAPPTRIRPLAADRLAPIVERLGIPAEHILRTVELDNGPLWQVLELDSAECLRELDIGGLRYPELHSVGLVGAFADGGECAFEVRHIAPSSGMAEDPITGSLNSALAHWLQADGRLQRPLVIAQGGCIGRHGRVYVRPPPSGEVAIGGQVHLLIDGRVAL